MTTATEGPARIKWCGKPEIHGIHDVRGTETYTMEGKADWEPTYTGERPVMYRCLGAQYEFQRVWADAVKTVKQAWKVLAPLVGESQRLKQSDFALSNPLPHEAELRNLSGESASLTFDLKDVTPEAAAIMSGGKFVGPSGHMMRRCARAFVHHDHDWDDHPLNPRDDVETYWCPGQKPLPTVADYAAAQQEPVNTEAQEPVNWPQVCIPLNMPLTDKAYDILHGPLWQAVQLFVRNNNEYGEEGANQLGLGGQYADINRKVLKLKRVMWDRESAEGWREKPDEIMMDLIGHLLLSIQMYREETGY